MGARAVVAGVTSVLIVAAATLWFVAPPESYDLVDIDGVTHGSLARPDGQWNVLIFQTTDCPIANQYAPEIQRICVSYGPKGVHCFLVYVDSSMTRESVRKHMADFGYSCCTPLLDKQHRLVK